LAVGGPVLDALPGEPIAITDNLLQFAEAPPGRPPGRINHVPGCNLAIKKSLFFRVGGFPDEPAEDVKFSVMLNRIQPEGYYFAPGMQIAHTGRTTWVDFLEHQRNFGYLRGYYRLLVSERQVKLGKHLAAVPFVVLKRLFYITRVVIKWNLKSIFRDILLLPLILVGLTAWAVGYRQGCLDNMKD
jgi:hypothetical protein